MNIPKVVFKPMSLEDNIEIIKWQYFDIDENTNSNKYVLSLFPELSNIDLDMNQEKIYELIEQVVTKKYNEVISEIQSEIQRYDNIWKEYNDDYFVNLMNYFNVSLPNNIEQINAYIGLIPVFPRNLDDFSFSLCLSLNEADVVRVTAHETLHFMWFEKWKKMYSDTPRSHFDYPYLEWKYSEMVTDPILNNEPFNKLFSFQEKGYDSFYKLYDGNELVMDKLRNIYSTNAKVEDKIQKGYEYISGYFEEKNNKKSL